MIKHIWNSIGDFATWMMTLNFVYNILYGNHSEKLRMYKTIALNVFNVRINEHLNINFFVLSQLWQFNVNHQRFFNPFQPTLLTQTAYSFFPFLFNIKFDVERNFCVYKTLFLKFDFLYDGAEFYFFVRMG